MNFIDEFEVALKKFTKEVDALRSEVPRQKSMLEAIQKQTEQAFADLRREEEKRDLVVKDAEGRTARLVEAATVAREEAKAFMAQAQADIEKAKDLLRIAAKERNEVVAEKEAIERSKKILADERLALHQKAEKIRQLAG